MGEYADMMLEGEMCQWCGTPMDGFGFPGVCAGCQDEENVNIHGEKRTKDENRALHPNNQKPVKTIRCGHGETDEFTGCNRMFSSEYALAEHRNAKHVREVEE